MNWLEHGGSLAGWVEVRRRCDTNGASKRRSKVGEDVSVKIRGNDGVKTLWVENHARRL